MAACDDLGEQPSMTFEGLGIATTVGVTPGWYRGYHSPTAAGQENTLLQGIADVPLEDLEVGAVSRVITRDGGSGMGGF